MSKGGTTTSTSSIDPQIKEAFLANFQQAQGVAGINDGNFSSTKLGAQ